MCVCIYISYGTPASNKELKVAIIRNLKNEMQGRLKAVTGLTKMLWGYRS